MDDITIVLPSARAIRHEQLSLDTHTLFLPNFITMSDFISNLCLVKEYVSVDDDTRTLLLLEAANFENFSKLQIERNFFTFTKNSSYIFKLFQELSAECYDIENLSGADIYGEYEEHIEILQELYHRYEKLCEEKKVLDRIFLPKLYSFNVQYAKTHPKVEIHVDGHLTNFELELLVKYKEYAEVDIVFTASRFNKKMQERLGEHSFDLEIGYRYRLSLNTNQILEKTKVLHSTALHCESLSESLLQIAYVEHKVYEYIQKGYDPERIAVILPNEQSAELLRSFDTKGNFNFAMGESFTKAKIYKLLDAATTTIDQNSKENFARVQRVGESVLGSLLGVYHKQSSEIDLLGLLESFSEYCESKIELNIYKKELHKFKNIVEIMQDMPVKSLLNVFLSRLRSSTFDDVRGGKITVMGVLETRSVAFDGVIIIDFDDKNVPKRSDKDMFLNSQIRKNAGLPTMNDRENLQKHYYEMLINSAKEVSICYVDSEQSKGSRFLKQLGIKENNIHNEKEYANLLFERKNLEKKRDEEIVEPYSFDNVKLSNSRLKTYLSCKRKYYYSYVKHIDNHDIPRDMPQEHEIGTAVHEALKNLYTKKSSYLDVEELRRDLHKELEEVKGESELDKYLIALQKKKMDQFCALEVERFRDGWEVLYCEKNFEIEFCGMTLTGQIDRIDKKENLISVLDYKTGSYKIYNKNNFTEATDFQLEFYYLLASGFGNVECAFYDLKETEIVSELFLEEKLAILQSHIEDLKQVEDINFTKCEDTKECLYCPYTLICGR